MAAISTLGRQWSRDAIRAVVGHGQQAQQGRAQAYGRGHSIETKTFYGGRDVSQTDASERRITTASADREHRKLLEHDREAARTHQPMTAEEREAIHRDLERNGW